MEKAWELKGLIEELKAKGLDLAETAAADVVIAVIGWVEQSVIKSENKVDDLVLAFLPMVKKEALKLVDEINGKDDDGDGKPAASIAAE